VNVPGTDASRFLPGPTGSPNGRLATFSHGTSALRVWRVAADLDALRADAPF
jgi:hypothetical protein